MGGLALRRIWAYVSKVWLGLRNDASTQPGLTWAMNTPSSGAHVLDILKELHGGAPCALGIEALLDSKVQTEERGKESISSGSGGSGRPPITFTRENSWKSLQHKSNEAENQHRTCLHSE